MKFREKYYFLHTTLDLPFISSIYYACRYKMEVIAPSYVWITGINF